MIIKRDTDYIKNTRMPVLLSLVKDFMRGIFLSIRGSVVSKPQCDNDIQMQDMSYIVENAEMKEYVEEYLHSNMKAILGNVIESMEIKEYVEEHGDSQSNIRPILEDKSLAKVLFINSLYVNRTLEDKKFKDEISVKVVFSDILFTHGRFVNTISEDTTFAEIFTYRISENKLCYEYKHLNDAFRITRCDPIHIGKYFSADFDIT